MNGLVLTDKTDSMGRVLRIFRQNGLYDEVGKVLVEFHQSPYHRGRFYSYAAKWGVLLDAPPECIAAWEAGEPWQPVLDYLFERYPEETADLQAYVLAATCPDASQPAIIAL